MKYNTNKEMYTNHIQLDEFPKGNTHTVTSNQIKKSTLPPYQKQFLSCPNTAKVTILLTSID